MRKPPVTALEPSRSVYPAPRSDIEDDFLVFCVSYL